MSNQRVAIIGSGVSGSSCAWLLTRDEIENTTITIYEKGNYLGGHTNTVDIKDEKVIDFTWSGAEIVF